MGAINAVTDLSVEDGIAIITINNPPVNALGHAVREGIVQAMQNADADAAVKAVVVDLRRPHFPRRRRHHRIRQAAEIAVAPRSHHDNREREQSRR